MNQAMRGVLDRALQQARLAAYPTGEFVGQESFMRASEILCLALRAGVGPGSAVLDLCCGVAGPGRLITRELGCTYLGIDCSPAAIAIARNRSQGLPCRFEVTRVPPLPDGVSEGRYDVVLLFETVLAFQDKEALLREVSSALAPGGRFVFTLEEGQPLTEEERACMPNADTVWLTPLVETLALLDRFGLRVRWQAECTPAHHAVVDSLVGAFDADAHRIAAQIGRGALDDLVTSHRLWREWMGSGRVRKFAFIAEKTAGWSASAAVRTITAQEAAPHAP